MLNADRERLRQIVENLISNAVKYGKSAKGVIVEAEADDDSVRIRVKDEGAGIPREQLANIFNRFQRVPGHGGRGTVSACTLRLRSRACTVASSRSSPKLVRGRCSRSRCPGSRPATGPTFEVP